MSYCCGLLAWVHEIVEVSLLQSQRTTIAMTRRAFGKNYTFVYYYSFLVNILQLCEIYVKFSFPLLKKPNMKI